jgi:F420H(2)-dependent quinone reductase
LLTTTGRKSSGLRTTATPYLRDGDRAILPASFGGRQHNPLWYAPASGWGYLPLVGACPHNLKENPEVQVQIRAQRLHLRARDAADAERERYWPPLMGMYPPYRGYHKATDRLIPLVVGEPRHPAC